MDQELVVPKQNNNILISKVVIIAFIVVILGEGIWAIQTITKVGLQANTTSTPAKAKTKVSLTSPSASLRVGGAATVSINLSSGRRVEGTDLIIDYDPNILALQPTSAGTPVATGNIFSEYPQNLLDPKTGRITVSGVTGTQGGVMANGLFGTVTFKAKSPGQSKVAVEFKGGSTVSSNVVEPKSGANILDEVNNLTISVTP